MLGSLAIAVHLLRMPLHGQKPRCIGLGFGRLDQLIIGPAGREQAGREVLDRLMVGRVYRNRRGT
jgi:hypothetical protein